MPDTKPSAFPSLTLPSASTDQYIVIPSGGTASKITLAGLQQSLGAGYRNASTAAVAAGYAVDTYVAGSAVTVPAGSWKAGTSYNCQFDMTKTAAGTAAAVITVRMGTLGTTGDASITTFTFAAGTAAADTGIFEVMVSFRSVGAGTSAVIDGWAKLLHGLTTTGLSNNTTNLALPAPAASSGFNSTTQTIIGISFNGGASFSGTCVGVKSYVLL